MDNKELITLINIHKSITDDMKQKKKEIIEIIETLKTSHDLDLPKLVENYNIMNETDLKEKLKENESKIIQIYEEKEVIDETINLLLHDKIKNEDAKTIKDHLTIIRSLKNYKNRLESEISELIVRVKTSGAPDFTQTIKNIYRNTMNEKVLDNHLKEVKEEIIQIYKEKTDIDNEIYKLMNENPNKIIHELNIRMVNLDEELLKIVDSLIQKGYTYPLENTDNLKKDGRKAFLLSGNLRQNVRRYLKEYPKTTLKDLIEKIFYGHNQQSIKRHYNQFFKEKAEQFKQKLKEVKENE